MRVKRANDRLLIIYPGVVETDCISRCFGRFGRKKELALGFDAEWIATSRSHHIGVVFSQLSHTGAPRLPPWIAPNRRNWLDLYRLFCACSQNP